jgi:hypothetical protein
VAAISGPTLNCPPCSTGFNTIGASLTAADFLQFDPATNITWTTTGSSGTWDTASNWLSLEEGAVPPPS